MLLGGVQVASMGVYGDLARSPAVPLVIPAAFALRLAAPLGAPGMPAAFRIAYARALLYRGRAVAAAAIVARLPDVPDAADLRGQLAARAGHRDAALRLFAQAGDFERAQALIDTDVAGPASDVRLERSLAASLDGPGQATVRARALWRLGQLLEVEATRSRRSRPLLERDALAQYDAALAIAPNEETYLLAAGQQALTIGDRAAARRYYQRALDAVPNSADARAGLERAGR